MQKVSKKCNSQTNKGESGATCKNAFKIIALSLLISAIAVFAGATPSQAAFFPKDADVLIRSLYFAEPNPEGELKIGIVFCNETEPSIQEANKTLVILNHHPGAKNMRFKPELIKFGELEHKDLNAYDAFYITEKMGHHYASLLRKLNTQSSFVLSKDPACFDNAICVLQMNTQIGVTIKLNKQLAYARDISFRKGFKRLVRGFYNKKLQQARNTSPNITLAALLQR